MKYLGTCLLAVMAAYGFYGALSATYIYYGRIGSKLVAKPLLALVMRGWLLVFGIGALIAALVNLRH